MVQVAEPKPTLGEDVLFQLSRTDFRRHPDGTWETMRPLVIAGPGGEQVLIAAGRRFGKGQMFMFGLDLAAILERHLV